MKLALCKNNSEWGVQTFPMRENEYDIGITFDSEEIKQDYLSKKIFWPNYLDDLKKQPKLTMINTMRTSDSATFRLKLEQINDLMIPKDKDGKPLWTETQESVQNKDFLASLDEVTGQVKYWAISVSSVALNMYEFNAKLDEFANYDVRTNWKHSRQAHINQATTQDYYKDDKGYHTLNGLSNWNSVSEDFDDFDEKMYIPQKVQDINFDYSSIIRNGKNNANYQKINDALNEPNRWKIAIVNLKEEVFKNLKTNDEDITWIDIYYLKSAFSERNSLDDPVSTNVTIFNHYDKGVYGISTWFENTRDDIPYYIIVFDKKTTTDVNGKGLEKFLVNSDYTFSLQDLPFFPFMNNGETFDWDNDDIIKTDDAKNSAYYISALSNDMSAIADEIIVGMDKSKPVFSVTSLEDFFANGPETNDIDIPINWDLVKKLDGPFSVYSKTKILKSAYQKLRLRGTNDTDFDIRYEYLNCDSFKIKFGIIPNIDNVFLGAMVIPNTITKDTLYKGNSDDYRNEFAYKEFLKTNNILITSAYQDMISNEQNSINQQAKINQQNLQKDEILSPLKAITGTIFGGIGGAMGDSGSPLKAGIGAFGGALSGGSDIYSSILSDKQSIGSLNAKIKDASESPNKLKGDGLQLFVSKYTTKIKPQLIWLSLPPANINKISFRFHKYGEKLDIEEDINKFLDTHKYWDYIQAKDLFEIFDRQLSTQIRQNICGAMARGITIFHIREDWETDFKGIRYYDTPNPQMSEELIGSFKDWE